MVRASHCETGRQDGIRKKAVAGAGVVVAVLKQEGCDDNMAVAVASWGPSLRLYEHHCCCARRP